MSGWAIHAVGKLIALGEAGLLGLFKPDPSKCAELARWQVPGPELSNGRLYLRSEEKLVCVDIAKR